MAHALVNSTIQQVEEDYSIRRGSAFVNEYARTDTVTGLRNDGGPSNPNHLMGCFPTLFPYGKGGYEIDRPINVPYETHAYTISLPGFWNMSEKRSLSVCGTTDEAIAIRSTNQPNSAPTPQDLINASQEETRKVRFSNPAVQALRNHLGAVRTRVKGTDESRQRVRSQVWGTNLILNPPTLWITINPADTQDPITQVFAGVEIDLDKFCNLEGPNNAQMATNVSKFESKTGSG